MKKIEQKVIKFIKDKGIIANGDKILLALSGGPDSIFLLNFLAKFQDKFNIKVGVLHFNHLLRGKEANRDQDFSRFAVSLFNFPFYLETGHVKEYALSNKLSIEEAGRILRYQSLNKIAIQQGYNKIATAHNSNDNSETILLNLLKGSGLKGMRGIPVIRDIIIRPILCLTKSEIIDYLDKAQIKYIVDSSNVVNDYQRNYLRNNLIPLIKENINPSFEKAMLNFSFINNDLYNYIGREISIMAESIASFGNNFLMLSKGKLKQVNPDILTNLIKYILDKYIQSEFTYYDILAISKLIDKKVGKVIQMSNKFSALCDREDIIIYKSDFDFSFKTANINLGTKIDVYNNTLEIAADCLENVDFSNNKKIEYISGDNLEDVFTVRLWQNGDKFFPVGLKKQKLLSDFFTDIKLSGIEKKTQTVVLNKGNIVWVTGQRIDDRVKILNSTKKVIKLCLH